MGGRVKVVKQIDRVDSEMQCRVRRAKDVKQLHTMDVERQGRGVK